MTLELEAGWAGVLVEAAAPQPQHSTGLGTTLTGLIQAGYLEDKPSWTEEELNAAGLSAGLDATHRVRITITAQEIGRLAAPKHHVEYGGEGRANGSPFEDYRGQDHPMRG